ncbi:GTPase-activating protein [Acropora cervicornis]|uniref:GTPase-activating protein n=1 Tax=Acropora cervicornis TaxID=6130 RepID=A0AAD9VGV7_ACRCE|nr:GTPase-activating protein [Acropora cervicornis]
MAGLEDLTVLLEEEKPEESSFHKQIKVLKDEISELSKTNYDLEKEVRLLDQHIGFLVTYKKAIEESSENFLELERKYDVAHSDDKQQEKYGNLFFLLQTEASYLAQLTRIVSLGEIDATNLELALKYEVSESETFNSLLRANTAITRMMTTYTRRAPGQEYLKATLGELVKEVVEQKDLVLEINPQKEKYPEVGEASINSLIGGFFLLRFLNPAIVTPKAYKLVSSAPSQCARKNLTLIAKLIQSMANKHVVGSHFKEEHMQPLHPFAMRHVNEIQNFLTKLFNFNKITDFYETLEIEQYLSLSKDIKVTITPNEMYRIHELILKYKEELALTEDDPLHIILDELGPPGKQLSYSMNATISLALTNRWDHSKEMLTFRTPPVQQRCTKEQLRALFIKVLSMDTRLMEESSLLDVVTRAHFLPANRQSGGEEKDGQDTQERRKRLEEQKSKIAGYIYKKYKAHPELKGMLSKEPTLKKQNSYLKDQLSVYKVYLNSVRTKAATLSSKKCIQDVTHSERSAAVPIDFTYSQLEREGVISHGDWSQRLTEKRKPDLTITITCPQPGVYQISLRNRGDPKTDHEVHLNLEELLELQHHREPTIPYFTEFDNYFLSMKSSFIMVLH